MSDLWVCHRCEMIGTYAEAAAHRIVKGHDVERLDDRTAASVRAEWAKDSRSTEAER